MAAQPKPVPAEVPAAVAIVMDGNGRWAASRGLSVADGHRAGSRALRPVVETSIDLGIESLAVFAFSTENWTRPADEVHALMEIFGETIDRELGELAKEGVRTRFVGRRDRAVVGKPALFFGRKNANGVTGRPLQCFHELRGICALPARRGDEDVERVDAVPSRNVAELANRLCGRSDARRGYGGAPLDLLAERKPHAPLLDGHDLVSLDARDEQPDRVRASVDDPDAHRHES